MKRNFNNPTNFRVRQSGPKQRDNLDSEHYPLDNRELELEGEINSPTIPSVHKRLPTIDSEEAAPRGSIGESSHEAYEASRGHFPDVAQSQDTWDDPQEMTEDNVRMKYVKLGVESEDESYRADNTPKTY